MFELQTLKIKEGSLQVHTLQSSSSGHHAGGWIHVMIRPLSLGPTCGAEIKAADAAQCSPRPLFSVPMTSCALPDPGTQGQILDFWELSAQG